MKFLILALSMTLSFNLFAKTEISEEAFNQAILENIETLSTLTPGFQSQSSSRADVTQGNFHCVIKSTEINTLVSKYGNKHYEHQKKTESTAAGSKPCPITEAAVTTYLLHLEETGGNLTQYFKTKLFHKQSAKLINRLETKKYYHIEGSVYELEISDAEGKFNANFDLSKSMFFNPTIVNYKNAQMVMKITTSQKPNVDPKKLDLKKISVCTDIPIKNGEFENICSGKKNFSAVK